MPRTDLDFCRDWRFCKGDPENAHWRAAADADWQPVHLPHTWNVDDMFPGQPHEEAYVGPAWYRKTFSADLADDERYLLLFEGVANRSAVYVDGKLVGGRDGGFLSFCLDITEALDDSSDHVVAVRADNSFQWGSVPPDPIDWERFGGIYRRVHLLQRSGAHLAHKGVQITTPEVTAEQGPVRVSVQITESTCDRRQVTLRHRLIDPNGVELLTRDEGLTTVHGRSVTVQRELGPLPNPRLWSPDTPHLYQLTTELLDAEGALMDRDVQRFGFRWISFDPDTGFALNGVSMKLQGVDLHQEYPGLGWACPERFHRREAELLKAAGMNFMRASHYPRNEAFLDACDELGIMVMEEQPFWHGSLRVQHGPDFPAYCRQSMREMVRHHGNRTCIIMWNTVNEIMLVLAPQKEHPDPSQRTERNKLHPDEWPFAHQCLAAMYDELKRCDPARPVSMVIGGNWDRNEQAGLTELADVVAHNGGAFHAAVDGRPVYDVLKERHPDRISMLSEGILNPHGVTIPRRGQWQHELEIWKSYAADWSCIYERDWFCGGSMWVFADYSAKGTYRNMAILDLWRVPYEGFHFFRSQWTVDLMAHIVGHWDNDAALLDEREVSVFTNADEAELFLNGESLGRRVPDTETWPKLPHPPITWTAPFTPGVLEVRVNRGNEEAVDKRETSGSPATLVLEPENRELLADGRDVAFLDLTVVDDSRRRCYTVSPELAITVTGGAVPAGPATLTAAAGKARFAVRSTGAPGAIQVSVSAPGLSATECIINAVD